MSYTKSNAELVGNIASSELKLGVSKTSEKPYAMFTVAVNGSGERPADFHTVLVWGESRIDYLKAIFKKGLYMHINARMVTNTVKDDNEEFVRKEYYFYADSFHAIHVAPKTEANVSEEKETEEVELGVA